MGRNTLKKYTLKTPQNYFNIVQGYFNAYSGKRKIHKEKEERYKLYCHWTNQNGQRLVNYFISKLCVQRMKLPYEHWFMYRRS